MSKKPEFDMTAIESRAWQLHELFRTIDNANPVVENGQTSVSTIALLGSELASELAEYAGGDRSSLLGMASTSTEASDD